MMIVDKMILNNIFFKKDLNLFAKIRNNSDYLLSLQRLL